MNDINWTALRAPFTPDDVDFRLQSTFNQGEKIKGIAIAYMDARLVQDRLDEVVGPENWSFDWQPMATKDNAVIAAKGTLTICGVSKSDIGDCDATERNKASVSDAFKSAAVMWGIGRYMYGLRSSFCEVEVRGQTKVIPAAEIKRLRATLPKATPAKPAPSQTQPTPIRPAVAQPAPATAPMATSQQAANIRKAQGMLGKDIAREGELEQMAYADAADLALKLSAEWKARQAEGGAK